MSVINATGIIVCTKSQLATMVTENTLEIGKQYMVVDGMDTTPTEDSVVPCTSGGIKTALDAKVSLTGDQTIADIKTFTSVPIIPDVDAHDLDNVGAVNAKVLQEFTASMRKSDGEDMINNFLLNSILTLQQLSFVEMFKFTKIDDTDYIEGNTGTFSTDSSTLDLYLPLIAPIGSNYSVGAIRESGFKTFFREDEIDGLNTLSFPFRVDRTIRNSVSVYLRTYGNKYNVNDLDENTYTDTLIDPSHYTIVYDVVQGEETVDTITMLSDISSSVTYKIIVKYYTLGELLYTKIHIPFGYSFIGANAFDTDLVEEVHIFDLAVPKDYPIASVEPPTIGSNAFGSNSALKIYVPYGTASTFQTAWTEYASNIVEEVTQYNGNHKFNDKVYVPTAVEDEEAVNKGQMDTAISSAVTNVSLSSYAKQPNVTYILYNAAAGANRLHIGLIAAYSATKTDYVYGNLVNYEVDLAIHYYRYIYGSSATGMTPNLNPTYWEEYNIVIDKGDRTSQSLDASSVAQMLNYSNAGMYIISISGYFNDFYVYNGIDKEKYIEAYIGTNCYHRSNNSFDSCSNITTIKFAPGWANGYSYSGIYYSGSSKYYGCTSLIDYQLPSHISIINDAFMQNCTSIQTIKIADNVTAISASAYNGCSSALKLIFPYKATAITLGSNVFSSVKIADLIITGGATQAQAETLRDNLIAAGLTMYANYRLLY